MKILQNRLKIDSARKFEQDDTQALLGSSSQQDARLTKPFFAPISRKLISICSRPKLNTALREPNDFSDGAKQRTGACPPSASLPANKDPIAQHDEAALSRLLADDVRARMAATRRNGEVDEVNVADTPIFKKLAESVERLNISHVQIPWRNRPRWCKFLLLSDSLFECANLKYLHISCRGVAPNPSTFRRLERLPQLTMLSITGADLRLSDFCSAWGNLDHLNCLALSDMHIDDLDLLLGHLPNLQMLRLAHVRGVDKDTIGAIAELTKLKCLELVDVGLTESGLAPLGQMRALACLDVSHNKRLKPAALRVLFPTSLQSHTSLEQLIIEGVKINNVSVDAARYCRTLRRLWAPDSRLSQAAMQQLGKAHHLDLVAANGVSFYPKTQLQGGRQTRRPARNFFAALNIRHRFLPQSSSQSIHSAADPADQLFRILPHAWVGEAPSSVSWINRADDDLSGCRTIPSSQ